MVKGFLLCCRKVTVHNREVLHKIVLERPKGQSLITISNHISTVDDPSIWVAGLPLRNAFRPDMNRWTLGAKEIMFKNFLDSWFFSKGQVIPTVRGDGIFQKAMHIALQKLNAGKWVHMFPEGKIHNSETFELYKFRWGVGRLADEAVNPPWILPIYIRGFNDVMNHGKAAIPRPFGKSIEIFIGEPIKDVGKLRDSIREQCTTKSQVYTQVTASIEQKMKDMAKKINSEYHPKDPLN